MLEIEIDRAVFRVPFAFGEIVYHRARTDKIAGVVIGYVILDHIVKVLVRWGNDLEQGEHSIHEVSTEYEPPFI